MTQRVVALALGVAGGERVSAWEAGRRTPRDTQLAPLAEILDVSVEELVPGERALRLMRFKAGLSVPSLAAAMSVSVRTVFRWEAGEYAHLPPDEVLGRLADLLGTDAARIEGAFRHGRS